MGDQTYVTVVEPGVAFWAGVATYSAANELTLTTVEETKGTFGAGTKEVMAAPLASTSMFREDIAGAIVTDGTSTAYTVASYRKYGSLTELDGNIIAFTPHLTNAQGATIAIDGLAAKPIRLSPGVNLESGVLIAGTPYLGLYNHADEAVYLHGMGGNAYGIPLGAGMDYWGATTPSSAFAFPIGQAISRITYDRLFALIGTTYGSGDGSTTFNLPDKTERVSVMRSSSPSRLTASYFGSDSSQLGAVGGSQSNTLVTDNLPPYQPEGSVAVASSNVPYRNANIPVGGGSNVTVVDQISFTGNSGTLSLGAPNASFLGEDQGGISAPFRTVQPTIVCNYILRVM
ncbi:phage tail protein [Bradyrhizobium guangdongense]|uniref:phage tail protein n=1 Tax=Bradyrhizobium guangdongense TaxID=1325090 RepID=UPI001FD8D974|nr:tail fiber protein [Bradyrhizobium guangdongense]